MTKSRRNIQSMPLEKWLSLIAIFTTTFYILTFSIEIGFFWNIGLKYMSAFSLFDHTVHAAAYSLSTIGLLVFAWLVFSMPAILFSLSEQMSSEYEDAQDETSVATSPRSRTLARISALLMLMFILPALWSLIEDIVNDGLRPMSCFGGLFAVTVMLASLQKGWQQFERLWILPALLTGLIAPVAFGDFLLNRELSERSASIDIMKVRDIDGSARVIFVGTERVLLQTSRGIFLSPLTETSEILVTDKGRSQIERSAPPKT